MRTGVARATCDERSVAFTETSPCHQLSPVFVLLAQSSISGWMCTRSPSPSPSLPGDAKTPSRVDRLPNDLVKLKGWLERAGVDLIAPKKQGRVVPRRSREHARWRYGASHHGWIPEPRALLLPRNPILAALETTVSNRRISAELPSRWPRTDALLTIEAHPMIALGTRAPTSVPRPSALRRDTLREEHFQERLVRNVALIRQHLEFVEHPLRKA